MKTLKELIGILTRYKVKSIKIIGNPRSENGKPPDRYWTFYEALTSGKLKDDAEAASLFGMGPKDKGYYNLKAGLKKRLLNTVFFINVKLPQFNDVQCAYYSCYKALAQIKILQGRGARNIAIELSKKVLKIATKFEYSQIAWELADLLKNHYATTEGDSKKYQYYQAVSDRYFEILKAEYLAKTYYEQLVLPHVRSKAYRPKTSELAEKFTVELEPMLKKYDASLLHYYGRAIKVLGHMSGGNYQKAINEIREALSFFSAKSFKDKVASALFQQQLVACNFALKRYQAAESGNLQCLEMLSKGSSNWFKCLELMILIQLHAGKYDAAWRTFQKTRKHEQFENLDARVKEFWKILEAWLYYLEATGNISFSASFKCNLQKFRLGKFLNEVPIFSKDKQGLNIPILLIQILFLLLDQNYEAIDYRIKALEKYRSRYLQNNETRRSNYFIKMLAEMNKVSYDQAAVRRNTKKLLKKLQSIPIHFSFHSLELEVLPYEMVWEIISKSYNRKQLIA